MILWRNIENYDFLSFDSCPRFCKFLLYVRCKSGVTFVASTLHLRGNKSIFSFLFHFSMKFLGTNSSPDHFAASYLGLYCLPMSPKKDARVIWVKLPRNEASRRCRMKCKH